MADLPTNPNSREEQYLASISGQDVETPACPYSRKEAYLEAIDERVESLQDELETLENNPDVVDIVDTYADLQAYDKTKLTDNDIIRVLNDETRDGNSTYYRYDKDSTSSFPFDYIGSSKTYDVFTGTDGTNAGTKGLVPAPAITDVGKFLKADGTWDDVSSSSVNVVQTTGQSTTDVMSQKATTDAITIDSISVNGTAVTPDVNKNVALTIPEGIKTLTTEDYNWPTTGTKTAIAPWLLSDGFYKVSSGCRYCYTMQSGGVCGNLSKDIFIQVIKDVYGHALVIEPDWNHISGGTIMALDASGLPMTNKYSQVLRGADCVNSLTSTSQYAPLSAGQGKYLNDNKADKTAFTGATASAAGVAGLVPAPAAGDESKVLKGDGTWAIPEGGIKTLTEADYNYHRTGDVDDGVAPWLLEVGVYLIDSNIPVYTRGSSDSALSVSEMLFSVGRNSSISYVSYYGDSLSGRPRILAYNRSTGRETTMQSLSSVSLYDQVLTMGDIARSLTADYPNQVLSASQGKILNDRIGDLSTLTTTAKTSAVAAINELDSDLGGLKLVSITQTDYDALATKDPNTLYVITGA